MSSSFGTLFKVTTFGESHGKVVGAVVDGCPSRLPLSEADIQPQLDRRRPGQSMVTSSRQEKDVVTILSGVDQGLTLGSPIALVIENTNIRPADYAATVSAPRPSHADFTYKMTEGNARRTPLFTEAAGQTAPHLFANVRECGAFFNDILCHKARGKGPVHLGLGAGPRAFPAFNTLVNPISLYECFYGRFSIQKPTCLL